MSTLKKSLTRVKSTLNRTTSKLSHNNTSNNNTESLTPIPLNTTDTQETLIPTITGEQDYFSLKYEDIDKKHLQNRKRNFSLANSITSSSSSSRKKSSEFPESLSRSESISSSIHGGILQDSTDTTIIVHPEDPLSEEVPTDLNNSTTLTTITTSGANLILDTTKTGEDEGLLPPVLVDGQAPCNNEELSPIIPSSISPISESSTTQENFSVLRQNSATSTVSAPIITSRARLLSNLRSSITSQSSLPILTHSSSITPIAETESSSSLNNFKISSSSSAMDQPSTAIHTEDDIADAMAISILEKVPHHQELSVEDWCI